MKKIPVIKNEQLTLEVLDLTFEGFGVVKKDGFPIFVENSIPGETVTISVTKVTKRYAYGRIISIENPSPKRVALVDKVGTRIGTMPLQHMAYDLQCEYKQNQVKATLGRVIDLEGVPVLPTLGMENPWHYRNKATIPVQSVKGVLETGFFKRGTHELIPVENFYIQEEALDKAILVIRDLLRHFKIEAYQEANHTGLIRNIMVRQGHYTEELMVVLVTNGTELPFEKDIVNSIVEALPKTVSIVQNINTKQTNVILGSEQRILFGEDLYHDQLLGKTFKISSKSFFQINTKQTEVLYQQAIEMAEVTSDDVVVDAYCGIGSITLKLADKAKFVYGVEIVEDAIIMAKENAKLNHIENVQFEVGEAEKIMPTWVKEGIEIDVLVVDPPRKGLDPLFIDAAIASKPRRIVYVSCNPISLAKDLRSFIDGGYRVEKVQPVDMFPQTTHVETVVLLSKLDSKRHISVELPIDEMDLTSAESNATYNQIQNYILEKFRLKVSTLYIAQVKRKYGLDVRKHYNISKNENQKVLQCPIEKEEAILDALKHFKMM